MARRIFSRSSFFIMSRRTSSDSDSMPSDSIQQPDARSLATNSGLVRLSARPFPNHRTFELAGDELVAEAGEALRVQRDRVAPQVEVIDAEARLALLDLVHERDRVAFPELVALDDRRHAEVAAVRAAAARLDHQVARVLERQAVAIERQQVPRRARHRREARIRPERAMGQDRAAPPDGQAVDAVGLIERLQAGEFEHGVLGLADDHRVHVRRALHRGLRRRRRVGSEATPAGRRTPASACAPRPRRHRAWGSRCRTPAASARTLRAFSRSISCSVDSRSAV